MKKSIMISAMNGIFTVVENEGFREITEKEYKEIEQKYAGKWIKCGEFHKQYIEW